MKTCKTISLSLAKGGVGKTTTAVNIGTALAAQGYRVALIDGDSQGSLSIALGLEPKALKRTLASQMMSVLDDSEGRDIRDCMVPCGAVDLLPSNPKLSLIEKRLTVESKSSLFADPDELPAELVLRKTLEPLREMYDYILIDCPPSTGMLTIGAMAASDSVLIPMESHFLGHEAVKQTLDIISRVRAGINPSLQVEGILLTKYQDRTSLCKSIRSSILETYGENLFVFPEPIAYSIKAAEQTLIGASIFETDPRGKIAQGYHAAALEVIAHG